MNGSLKKLILGMALLPLLAGQVFAQVADPRVSQLEEQVRNLTGKIEELNFQILQMQEQMRKGQEDNEFRFQELEKNKRSDAGGRQDRAVASASHAAKGGASGDASSTALASPSASGAAASGVADSIAIDPQGASDGRGVPPRALGTIRFDANGNVIGETLDEAATKGSGPAPSVPAGGNTIASLPETDNPNELYKFAYQNILSGDYRAAEKGFREHIKRYPADPMTADARFWLGESLYGQERYPEAATVFIDTQRDYPQSKRGAENLLKLGMTLVKMKDHEVACATFAEVPVRYPGASQAVLNRVTEERAKNRC
ncbi:tol-pal system protein YbgF [Brucella endophytica]|uniref:Cell division coordinator CpoB n=1 Tax=Brucella endophytica TaxID=1963359 RepID=A0A916SGD1_9HYPH|nr:tol-pal system protein YbgF [Brucella endophytica]